MNASADLIAGPAGALQVAVEPPAEGTLRGVAVICHPHPQFGGTMDNKVVTSLSRAFSRLGYRAVRFNFRGVGRSQGSWDEGRGEVEDALAVIAAQDAALPLVLAGFSFGGYVAASAVQRLPQGSQLERLVLVAPSTQKQQVPPVPANTLVIHPGDDEVVPVQATLDWARPQGLHVEVVPGAGHFFHGQLVLLKQLVTQAWASE